MGTQHMLTEKKTDKRKVFSTYKLYWRGHDLNLNGTQSSIDT